MDDDASSMASVESAADKEAAKKKRSTKEELATKRIAELAQLKDINLSVLSENKRKSILGKIEKLEAQVKVDELSRTLSRSKSSSASTGPGSSNAPRAQFSEEEVIRLIYARTALDHEFQQHVNSSTGKWSMIADKFNNGFTVSKDKLAAGAVDDVSFGPLIKEKHKTDDTLCRKWEKLTHDFRNIVCAKLEDSVQLRVHQKTHASGEKRGIDALTAEVLARRRRRRQHGSGWLRRRRRRQHGSGWLRRPRWWRWRRRRHGSG
jgi:hypothetical protein